MKKLENRNIRFVFIPTLLISFSLLVFTASSASITQSEVEPNDTPATATGLGPTTEMTGEINPVADQDYYVIGGINNLWGFIAVLDTTASTTSQDGTLTAFGSDGTTELQTDSGSWSNGSVIAWQRFVNGGAYHYIRVTENGDDANLGTYALRYYSVAISEQPEVEPNDTPGTGTVSAKAMKGSLADEQDMDCYRMSVASGKEILVALNADMQNDGSSTDFILSLYDPSDALVSSVDVGVGGGNEIILDVLAGESGVYVYCVSSDSGGFNPGDEYLVGPLVNESNYWSTYSLSPSWLNPGPGGNTIPGSLLEFELKFTNTDLLPIPGLITLRGEFDAACLTVVDAPGASSVYSNRVEWVMNDLPAGESFTRHFTARANAACDKDMHQGVSMNYFSLGVGQNIDYVIVDPGSFLPFIITPQ